MSQEEWNERARVAGDKAAAKAKREGASQKEISHARNRAYKRVYRKSPKGKAAGARWKESPKGKATNARYEESSKGKATKALRRRKVVSRYLIILRRHKRVLASRGVKGRPISLKAYQKKLYYADGKERLCYYCWGKNNETGSGLDRLDNNVTYTVKNTVPACRGCNTWRGNTYTAQETFDHFKPMRDAVKSQENLKLRKAGGDDFAAGAFNGGGVGAGDTIETQPSAVTPAPAGGTPKQ